MNKDKEILNLLNEIAKLKQEIKTLQESNNKVLQLQPRNTKVKCYLTGCKYNTACCTDPHDYTKRDFHCTKSDIVIDLDDCDIEGGFTCTSLQSGNKKHECDKCKLLKAGESMGYTKEQLMKIINNAK